LEFLVSQCSPGFKTKTRRVFALDLNRENGSTVRKPQTNYLRAAGIEASARSPVETFSRQEEQGMIRVSRIGTLAAVLAGWIAFGAGEVKAGLLPISANVTQTGSTYTYTYGIVLTSDSVLKKGDYFTIYDVNGLVANSNSQPAGFTFSSSNSGPTPSGTLPTDSPTIPNVTWTYTGPTEIVGQVGLGNFMFQSTYGATTTGSFTGNTQRLVDGVTDSNITTTTVPVPGAPEPASLLLAAIGLPLLGLRRAMQRRRS
jgi:hypothetical protein